MASSITQQPLTQYLLNLDREAFKNATEAKFLEKAGKGTLSKEVLQKWLSQDRLYAQAYIRFASLLLANTPLPSTVAPEHVNEQLVDLILDSLTNVRRELKFFEGVAERYGMDINAKDISEGVKLYRRLFFGTGEGVEAGKIPFLDALVVLWGTEKCYLEAWRYASTFSAQDNNVHADEDGGALRKEFIPNWTSTEFVAFVDKIGEFVDLLWKGSSGFQERRVEGSGVEKEESRRRMEGIWGRLLEAERVFWPVV